MQLNVLKGLTVAKNYKVLDTLWSKVVKIRAGDKCEYCGKTTGLNSHHIFSRSNLKLRWDLDNGICLCVAHHVFGNFSAHKAPLEFAEWIKKKRGQEWYDSLMVKSRSTNKKVTDTDKINIKIKLKAELDKNS